jgi:hypothetical protein
MRIFTLPCSLFEGEPAPAPGLPPAPPPPPDDEEEDPPQPAPGRDPHARIDDLEDRVSKMTRRFNKSIKASRPPVDPPPPAPAPGPVDPPPAPASKKGFFGSIAEGMKKK